MLEAVEQAVLTRQRRPAVRLQISPEADPPHHAHGSASGSAWGRRRSTRSTGPLRRARP